MQRKKRSRTSYEDAGVSIDRGSQLVERIRAAARSTRNAGVMDTLGGFGALYDLAPFSYKDPVLVSGTDGVGTKVKLAVDMGKHDTIGIDLVAMCANDLLVQGAQPLFFLDYFACAKLDVDIAATVIRGIADGCRLAGCALIGGETAEMPGMYPAGEYDLAGFAVGVVEKSRIIDGSGIVEGDVVLGLASSGAHSNGYSLIRKIIAEKGVDLSAKFHGRALSDVILEPTRIYVKPVLKLVRGVAVKGLAHITGGGLLENVPRIMPARLAARIERAAWNLPPLFQWLKEDGNIADTELYRVFNCGIGMVAVVGAAEAGAALKALRSAGESAWRIGRVVRRKKNGPQVVIV